MGRERMNRVNTPYDDVFRTLLNDCSSLIIPLINEVFGEDYTGAEEISFSPNEHFLNRQDGREPERITDSSFSITGKEIKKYHWECQSSADSSMLVRFFEYDTQIALDGGEIRGNVLTVTFPHSAALFLRCGSTTPDRLRVRIITPDGSTGYAIPVVKAQRYGLEEIFGKKLLFLIPFYIFSHETRFDEYDKDAGRLNALTAEYAEIRNRLEKLLEEGEISEYTKCTITDMSNKVLEHIAAGHENIRKGVKDVMGGKVLEYEAKTIRNEGLREGRNEGLREGRNEGKLEMLFDLVDDGLLPLGKAALKAHMTEEAFHKEMLVYLKSGAST